MLLDRAGCDLLTICDITGHSYSSAQTIVKHYRARNALRADMGIDRLVPLHRGNDGLEHWQEFRVDQHLDASCDARLSADEALALEG